MDLTKKQTQLSELQRKLDTRFILRGCNEYVYNPQNDDTTYFIYPFHKDKYQELSQEFLASFKFDNPIKKGWNKLRYEWIILTDTQEIRLIFILKDDIIYGFYIKNKINEFNIQFNEFVKKFNDFLTGKQVIDTTKKEEFGLNALKYDRIQKEKFGIFVDNITNTLIYWYTNPKTCHRIKGTGEIPADLGQTLLEGFDKNDVFYIIHNGKQELGIVINKIPGTSNPIQYNVSFYNPILNDKKIATHDEMKHMDVPLLKVPESTNISNFCYRERGTDICYNPDIQAIIKAAYDKRTDCTFKYREETHTIKFLYDKTKPSLESNQNYLVVVVRKD